MRYLVAQYSWRSFFTLAIGLLIGYILLGFLNRILSRVNFLGKSQQRIQKTVDALHRMAQPTILLFLLTVFILVKPTLHGLLVALGMILGFQHLRNYVSGIILRFQNKIAEGKIIALNYQEGAIDEIGALGLQVSTSTGVAFVGYDQLMKNGFTLASGDNVGKLVHLQFTSLDNEPKGDPRRILKNLMVDSPYLDWQHPPEFMPVVGSKNINSTILLKEESHLPDLLRSIEEWGFQCIVQN